MDNAEIKRRWREKNATRAKALAVAVPGVGQVYVRPLKVADGNALAALANSTDDEAKATIMASLLCQEDGKRLARRRSRNGPRSSRTPTGRITCCLPRPALNRWRATPGKLTPRQAFIFDLALELGMTVGELSEQMEESELRAWQNYSRQRWLPGRRLELLLANIARMSADADSIVPFVFDPALARSADAEGGGNRRDGGQRLRGDRWHRRPHL